MTRLDGYADAAPLVVYIASAPSTRAADHYTARIVPAYPGVNVPLEAPLVLWQR
jgi:starch phosphorylase